MCNKGNKKKQTKLVWFFFSSLGSVLILNIFKPEQITQNKNMQALLSECVNDPCTCWVWTWQLSHCFTGAWTFAVWHQQVAYLVKTRGYFYFFHSLRTEGKQPLLSLSLLSHLLSSSSYFSPWKISPRNAANIFLARNFSLQPHSSVWVKKKY